MNDYFIVVYVKETDSNFLQKDIEILHNVNDTFARIGELLENGDKFTAYEGKCLLDRS